MLDFVIGQDEPRYALLDIDFGWEDEQFDYMIQLLKRSAAVLPTYDTEGRYLKLIEKLEQNRRQDNSTFLSTRDMADLLHCMMEFMCEADVILGITNEEEPDYSEEYFKDTEYVPGHWH